MADISSYLAAIMAAVYGEDVRGSIHDAIDIINKVGEVVLNTGTAVTGPTSSSTGFYDGSFYINTNTMELWKCIGTDAWQSQGVLKGADGADGNGIVSIVKTATVGLVDTYTITFDDGSTETYQITNGQNGSKWYKGTAISGTGTSITGFPGTKDDYYLNSVDGYVYVCTKTGGAMVPDAAEWDYVMTLTGGGGGSITVIDNLISTSSTDALSANQGRVLNTSKIDNPSTKSDGQVLTYNAIDDEWEARNATGGGMLPYLYIDSEAGATVTVVQPDSTTITPTAAGSGHWECELTGGYGTYVIYSVLAGQGDATQSLVVDTVMEYHVTDTHYDHTVSFVAPSGSTVRIVGGTETYTLTGTGSTQTQAVHSPSTSFTVTATMDGNGKPYTFTTPSTTGQTTTIPSGTFDFGTINVSVAADFVTAGSTITCVNGGTSCTPKTAASTLVFRVPTTGTWTISGTVSGQTYTTTATVTALGTPVSTSLQTVPDGSTVLPTDDIPTWLDCGGLSSTGYTTLSQVLADSTTLLALMSDNNAVDYMVRSKTWITGKGLIPVMTSNTSPKGNVTSSSIYSSTYDGWKAFNGNSTSMGWEPAELGVPQWVQYEFESPCIVHKFENIGCASRPARTFELHGSNDNFINEDDLLGTIDAPAGIATTAVNISNTKPYKYYRMILTAITTSYIATGEGDKFQLYSIDGNGITDDSTAMTDIGANNYCADTLLDDEDWNLAIAASTYVDSVLNVKVPTLSSSSTGASAENHYGTDDAWKAFDNNDATSWYSSNVASLNESKTAYIQYQFTDAVRVVNLYIKDSQNADYPMQYTNLDISGSTDGITFTPIYTYNTAFSGENSIAFTNNDTYKYYRVNVTAKTGYNGVQCPRISTLQFYGREDV